MGALTVQLCTLTPLWTGGVDGTMDRIHETGILGSLRWWYEAIVRGLGGWACDPTGENRCPDRDGKYCDVCAVFGATGLQRAFRLEEPVWWNEDRNRRLRVKVNNNRGWYLGRGFMGQRELRLRTLRLPEGWTESDLQQTMLLILRLISCWGGLGPKTQQGYGVVKIDPGRKLDISQAIQAIQKLQQRSNRRPQGQSSELLPLDGFFFAKVWISLDKPKDWLGKQTTLLKPDDEVQWYLRQDKAKLPVVPLAPVVRYHLWQRIKQAGNSQNSQIFSDVVRHHLMGEQGRKSLIHVSHAYAIGDNQWEFRIWGWIPKFLPGNMERATVLDCLRRWLGVDKNKERQWHSAQTCNDTLWSQTRLNLNDVQVCWFAKKEDEELGQYLEALLTGCNCENHTETQRAQR